MTGLNESCISDISFPLTLPGLLCPQLNGIFTAFSAFSVFSLG